MKLVKKYLLAIEHYDYFGSHKHYSESYKTLAEAWQAYRIAQTKYDFEYNDAFHHTQKPVAIWTTEVEQHVGHGRVYGHRPTIEDVWFNAADIKHACYQAYIEGGRTEELKKSLEVATEREQQLWEEMYPSPSSSDPWGSDEDEEFFVF